MSMSIYLRRYNKVILEAKNSEADVQLLATLHRNASSLGYILDQKVIDILKTYGEKDLTEFNKALIDKLKILKGGHVTYKPMYPNFPEQVMSISDMELYYNAVVHYFGINLGVNMLPQYEKETRVSLDEFKTYTTISLGSDEEYLEMFLNIMGSKTSISEQDQEDLKYFLEASKENIILEGVDSLVVTLGLAGEIPNKEVLVFIAKILYGFNKLNLLKDCFKTATDILRLATGLSEGDITLKENCKFKKFKNSERRLLLEMLDKCSNLEDDMNKYKYRWLRLGEILHPGDYKNRYKNAFKSFNTLRNEKIITFNSLVEKYFKAKDLNLTLETLLKRPGILARSLNRLSKLCSTPEEKAMLFAKFESVVDQISSPVIYQLLGYFKSRWGDKEFSVIFPKGNLKNAYVLNKKLPALDSIFCDKFIDICSASLIKRYAKLSKLGGVYLDNNLSEYVIPFSQRGTSSALNTLTIGSRISLPEDKNTIRFFTWWKNLKTKRIDVDLSCVLASSDLKFKKYINYFNLRDVSLNICHSGDITTAPNGACEFIDIDIAKCLAKDIKYIIMSINNYTGVEYKDMEECFAGWMMREKPQSGEIFDARSVHQKFDLRADSTACVPIVIDLKERQVYWADLSYKTNRGPNNIQNNSKSLEYLLKTILNIHKTRCSIYDMLQLHVQARGHFCEDKNTADVIFSENKGITPAQIDKIVSYL